MGSSNFLFMFMLTFTPAAAVLAPNMTSFNLPSSLPADEPSFNCCAPLANYTLRLFTPNFSSTASPVRVRSSAHGVDEAYAQKLARAYALMKALPADDPRSFMQQANIHCAYCNAVYNQMNSSQLFQIHGTWLFFPFHRWYLYFHERILGKLLGDDNFAIPFWNYDHPERATIPWLYSTYNETLVDRLRDTLHNASTPAAINYSWDTDSQPREKQLRENANAMYRSLIRDTTSKEKFFGAVYRENYTGSSDAFGTVEKRPHNSIHSWIGQKGQVGWKDMGSLFASARDPLFYAHHAVLDRLWEVWKAMPGNYDIDDEDYLDAEFAFYNEDAELVRVKVRDALNTTELGYEYEEVENVWMEAKPDRRSEGEAKLTGNESMCVEGEAIKVPCSIVMERDVEGARGKEEYLQLEVEYPVNDPTYIDVYMNLPSANAETDTGCEEYYDYVFMLPGFVATSNKGGDAGNVTSTFTMAVGMRARLAALEMSEAASIVMTLVPRSLNTPSAFISLLHASIVIQLVDDYISTGTGPLHGSSVSPG